MTNEKLRRFAFIALYARIGKFTRNSLEMYIVHTQINKTLFKITDEQRPQLHLNVKKVERGAEHGEPSPLECIDLGDPAYSQDSHRSRYINMMLSHVE